MNILMVTSEATPFYKTGGLADMVSSLSRAILKEGHDIRVFLPLYNQENISFYTQFISASDIKFPRNNETVVFTKALDNGLTFYFLQHPIFSDRKGIYGENSSLYDDTLKRQVLFTKSIESLLFHTGFEPDIIHAHDWMTGLIPYYYRNKYKTLFTIHNIAFQGKSSLFEAVPIGFEVNDSIVERDEKTQIINSLKAAILNSNAVTTVSPTYAKEVLTKQFSEGLDDYLKAREKDLYGILNGIDDNIWNPSKDTNLEGNNYSIKNLAGKVNCKKLALKEFGFDENDKRPLVAIISRLAWQKGFYEILKGDNSNPFEDVIRDKSALFAIIGTGDKELEQRFKQLEENYDNVSFKNTFSEPLSHVLEAGSDFFLMPSVYEPCGLNQIYSLMYGSVPIVHKTGGLADTVIDETNGAKANGFVMDALEYNTIKETLNRAISCYNNRNERYLALQKVGMKTSFAWKKGAEAYIQLYEKINKEGNKK